MALIVEDGTVVANADAFDSEENITAYLLLHGNPSQWILATQKTRWLHIRLATQFLSWEYEYLGCPVSRDQVFSFPRRGIVIDGFILDAAPLPLLLRQATAELSFRSLVNGIQTDVIPGTASAARTVVERKRMDVFEKETRYTQSGSATQQRYPKVDQLIAPLIGGFNTLARG